MAEQTSRDEREAQGFEAASFFKNLGRDAVDSRTLQYQSMEQLDDADQTDAAKLTELTDLVAEDESDEKYFAQKARDTLKELDEFDKHLFYTKEGKHLPPIIKSWINLGDSIPDVSEDTIPDRLASLDDEQFLNYLQWHNNRYAEMQKQLEADLPEYDKRFTERVTAAVAEGWLPQVAADRLDRVGTRPVHVYDKFYDEGKDKNGQISSDMIILSGEQTQGEQGPESTLSHENTHLIAERDGGDGGIHFGEEYRWLNEAITEHINSALQYGRIDLVDPGAREAELGATAGSYPDERGRLAALVEQKGADALHTLISAYFETDTSKARSMVEEVLGAR